MSNQAEPACPHRYSWFSSSPSTAGNPRECALWLAQCPRPNQPTQAQHRFCQNLCLFDHVSKRGCPRQLQLACLCGSKADRICFLNTLHGHCAGLPRRLFHHLVDCLCYSIVGGHIPSSSEGHHLSHLDVLSDLSHQIHRPSVAQIYHSCLQRRRFCDL